jgi:integrase
MHIGGLHRAAVPEKWLPLIEDYLRHLIASGSPLTTVTVRQEHLARIARQLDPAAPSDLTSLDVRNWFAAERVRREWKTETHRSYRTTAVGFFGWAHTAGRLDADLGCELPKVRPEKTKPRPTPDRIWKAAKLAADARTGLMLRLAVELALRRSEVAKVHTDDVRDEVDGSWLLVHGKGARERVLPLTDDLANAICAGPAGHTPGAPAEGFLFPGSFDGHLSPKWVGQLCSDAMPGIWTLHTLRHRAATNALRGTRDTRAVQEFLGHASLANTQKYCASNEEDLRAAMMAAAQAS